mmetsp:Transcript_81036/g.235009  ORF Transcript_81036/g.235009 Transcript_81036/m.235009 type:complete len:228 (-) Transcript_81036:110-793(-)
MRPAVWRPLQNFAPQLAACSSRPTATTMPALGRCWSERRLGWGRAWGAEAAASCRTVRCCTWQVGGCMLRPSMTTSSRSATGWIVRRVAPFGTPLIGSRGSSSRRRRPSSSRCAWTRRRVPSPRGCFATASWRRVYSGRRRCWPRGRRHRSAWRKISALCRGHDVPPIASSRRGSSAGWSTACGWRPGRSARSCSRWWASSGRRPLPPRPPCSGRCRGCRKDAGHGA